jgi:hypothetical protein
VLRALEVFTSLTILLMFRVWGLTGTLTSGSNATHSRAPPFELGFWMPWLWP